ncbi:MAG: NAD-dependent epimerase/dehydratase family protein [Candidatus Velamenicoccus archaeovorus]
MVPHPLQEDLDGILQRTEGLWKDLRGQSFFFTGGTGFVGCWLLEVLLWANEKLSLDLKVTILTRDQDAFRRKAPHLAGHSAVRLHDGDVRDFTYPSGRFSHVIHASGQLKEGPVISTLDAIVLGTKHVLDFAVACGAKSFLFISSGIVYGQQPADMSQIPETYRGSLDAIESDYNATYGIGKLTAEHLCVLYSKIHALECKIARCFSFVGPYLPLDIHYAIGNFIRDGLNGKPIKVRGDGTPWRSYLYAADLAVWLWTIFLKGKACRPYNVGSDEAHTIADVARIVSLSFKHRPPIEIALLPVDGAPPQRYVPCVQRVASELGLRPYTGIEDAIKKTIAFYERHERSK